MKSLLREIRTMGSVRGKEHKVQDIRILRHVRGKPGNGTMPQSKHRSLLLYSTGNLFSRVPFSDIFRKTKKPKNTKMQYSILN